MAGASTGWMDEARGSRQENYLSLGGFSKVSFHRSDL